MSLAKGASYRRPPTKLLEKGEKLRDPKEVLLQMEESSLDSSPSTWTSPDNEKEKKKASEKEPGPVKGKEGDKEKEKGKEKEKEKEKVKDTQEEKEKEQEQEQEKKTEKKTEKDRGKEKEKEKGKGKGKKKEKEKVGEEEKPAEEKEEMEEEKGKNVEAEKDKMKGKENEKHKEAEDKEKEKDKKKEKKKELELKEKEVKKEKEQEKVKEKVKAKEKEKGKDEKETEKEKSLIRPIAPRKNRRSSPMSRAATVASPRNRGKKRAGSPIGRREESPSGKRVASERFTVSAGTLGEGTDTDSEQDMEEMSPMKRKSSRPRPSSNRFRSTRNHHKKSATHNHRINRQSVPVARKAMAISTPMKTEHRKKRSDFDDGASDSSSKSKNRNTAISADEGSGKGKRKKMRRAKTMRRSKTEAMHQISEHSRLKSDSGAQSSPILVKPNAIATPADCLRHLFQDQLDFTSINSIIVLLMAGDRCAEFVELGGAEIVSEKLEAELVASPASEKSLLLTKLAAVCIASSSTHKKIYFQHVNLLNAFLMGLGLTNALTTLVLNSLSRLLGDSYREDNHAYTFVFPILASFDYIQYKRNTFSRYAFLRPILRHGPESVQIAVTKFLKTLLSSCSSLPQNLAIVGDLVASDFYEIVEGLMLSENVALKNVAQELVSSLSVRGDLSIVLPEHSLDWRELRSLSLLTAKVIQRVSTASALKRTFFELMLELLQLDIAGEGGPLKFHLAGKMIRFLREEGRFLLKGRNYSVADLLEDYAELTVGHKRDHLDAVQSLAQERLEHEAALAAFAEKQALLEERETSLLKQKETREDMLTNLWSLVHEKEAVLERKDAKLSELTKEVESLTTQLLANEKLSEMRVASAREDVAESEGAQKEEVESLRLRVSLLEAETQRLEEANNSLGSEKVKLEAEMITLAQKAEETTRELEEAKQAREVEVANAAASRDGGNSEGPGPGGASQLSAEASKLKQRLSVKIMELRGARAETTNLENLVASLKAENAQLQAGIPAGSPTSTPLTPAAALTEEELLLVQKKEELSERRAYYDAEIVRMAEQFKRNQVELEEKMDENRLRFKALNNAEILRLHEEHEAVKKSMEEKFHASANALEKDTVDLRLRFSKFLEEIDEFYVTMKNFEEIEKNPLLKQQEEFEAFKAAFIVKKEEEEKRMAEEELKLEASLAAVQQKQAEVDALAVSVAAKRAKLKKENFELKTRRKIFEEERSQVEEMEKEQLKKVSNIALNSALIDQSLNASLSSISIPAVPVSTDEATPSPRTAFEQRQVAIQQEEAARKKRIKERRKKRLNRTRSLNVMPGFLELEESDA